MLQSTKDNGNLFSPVMSRDKAIGLYKVHSRKMLMVTWMAGQFLSVQAWHGIGEMLILHSAPPSATITALKEARVLCIEGDVFNSILLELPKVAVSVLRTTSACIGDLNERVGTNG